MNKNKKFETLSYPEKKEIYRAKIIKVLRDKGEATPQDVMDEIEKELNLSKEFVEQKSKGRHNTKYHYDIHWTRNDLREEGYIDNSTRGIWKLTEKGEKADPKNLKKIKEGADSDCIEKIKRIEKDAYKIYDKEANIYILVDKSNKKFYIGYTGDLGERLQKHNSEQIFDWDYALIYVGKNNDKLYIDEAMYFEYLALFYSCKEGRQNKKKADEPYVREEAKKKAKELFGELQNAVRSRELKIFKCIDIE